MLPEVNIQQKRNQICTFYLSKCVEIIHHISSGGSKTISIKGKLNRITKF